MRPFEPCPQCGGVLRPNGHGMLLCDAGCGYFVDWSDRATRLTVYAKRIT